MKDQIAITELQRILQETAAKNPDDETTEELIFVPKTENEYLIKNYIDFVNQGISISNFDTGTVPDSFATERAEQKNVQNVMPTKVKNYSKYFEQSQRKLVIP